VFGKQADDSSLYCFLRFLI